LAVAISNPCLFNDMTLKSPPRHQNQQSRVSPRLSRTARRLLFAYEDDLRRRFAGRRLAYQLGALAGFLVWLDARGVELQQAWPDDLAAWDAADARRRVRAGGRPSGRRLDAVRGLYRFLYCHGYLRHDPGAVLELPRRRTTR
jgi:hypothetical protein